MSRIATLRKQAGLTQELLAEKLGVGRTTVAMWETEANSPPTKYLLTLAEIFGCTVDELLKDDVDT